MTIFQAIFLGILQGITEFLPISSSGHLVIIPYLLGWKFPADQIFPFDVLVQIGTLIAVIAYYWDDLIQIAKSMQKGLKQNTPFEEVQARIGWLAILATIPAGVVGLLFKDQVENAFSRPAMTSALLIVTGVLLVLTEKIGKKARDLTSFNWLDALVMGAAQAVSIFPGISRSGSTISGGLARNLNRKTAGQFTFLMAIPIMAAAGLLSLMDLIRMPNLFQFLPVMMVGFITSGIVGFFSIRWLLNYISSHSLVPFAVYCLILGGGSMLLSGMNSIYPSDTLAAEEKETYFVTYSSSVGWIMPTINKCGEEFSGASIRLEQLDATSSLEQSDIHFSYDEIIPNPTFTYHIGADTLVVGVNPDSSIINLTADSVKHIYQGEIISSIDLQNACNSCMININNGMLSDTPLRIWGYEENAYLQKMITQTFQIQYSSPDMYVAPNPSLMEDAVLLEDTAIGIFPGKAISDRLKTIKLMDLPADQPPIPILASSETKPDPFLEQFVSCVQEKIK